MSSEYRLLILPRAARELASLPSEAYVRIREAARALAVEPRPKGSRKLTGRPGMRVRGGSWNSSGSYCRSANRNGSDPTGRDFSGGFRVVVAVAGR